MVIAIITETKALELKNTEYEKGVKYNPVQLQDLRWFISLVEAQYLKADEIVNLEDYVSLEEEV